MIQNKFSVCERLALRVCETDRFKAGFLSVSAVLPIREDAYMTSLLLAVLLRGSEHYPTVAAINRRLDTLYGTEVTLRNHYLGGLHVIGLCADVLGADYLPAGEDGVLDGALDMMRELLFHPALDENGLLLSHYVESEKRLQCDSIRAQKNNPHAYAVARASEIVYEGTPMRIPILGDEERVMAVTPEALTAHWRSLLSELALDCFYVGDTSGARVARALEETLGAELSSDPRRVCDPLPARRTPQDLRRGEETLPVTQGHLVMYYDTDTLIGDRALYAVILCCELLGGSPVSKLFMNVRERLGLCYSCHSTYNAYRGMMRVTCGLSNASVEMAEREIEAQLHAIAKGEVSDGEWIAAKKSLCNAYRQSEDSPVSMERFYFGRSLCGAEQSMDECRRAIEEVTPKEVYQAAARMRLDTVFTLRASKEGEEESADEED